MAICFYDLFIFKNAFRATYIVFCMMKIDFYLEILTFILLCPAVLACLYYCFLAGYSLKNSNPQNVAYEEEPQNNFAIIIPAHNEESVIAKTLKSCKVMEYPSDKFKIFVVADNCTDKTADIVKENGVTCLERNDRVNIGKGYALSWAFDLVLSMGFDGFVVIDADCVVDIHALQEFDKYFRDGYQALQANDVASNPDDSPMSYVVAVGNVIENDLFYAPKSDLGLSVFLRGTGMVFHRDLLMKFSWGAHSIVEDVEYSLNLLRQGQKVKFVKNVKVRSAFPVTLEQLNIQRTRWARGNLSFGKKNALKLLFEGVVQRKVMLMDAGFTFLVLSKPLVIAEMILTCLVSAANWFNHVSLYSTVCLSLALSILFCLVGYLSLGILRLGLNSHRLHLLLATPFVVFRLIVIAIINVFGIKSLSWQKTPR